MGGRSNNNSRNSAASNLSLEELKAQRKSLAEEYKNYIESHTDETGATSDMNVIKTMISMQEKLDDVTYELYSKLSPTVKEERWRGSGITDLTQSEAVTVRQDMLKNKEMYMAIASAQHGVAYNGTTADTAVDKLYNKNPDKTYKVFEPTRNMLRKKYGDTMTLYRVPTNQTAKATVNMTSTRANAEQYAQIYGRRVESIKVPVKDILAVNIARTGGYEEFIVLNKRKKW